MQPQWKLLIIIYAVPIVRLLLFFLPAMSFKTVVQFSALTGRYEWLVRLWRDIIIAPILIILSARGAYLYVPFILISLFAALRFKFHARRMAEFGRINPFINPKDFFNYYYAGLGMIPIKLPKSPQNLINPSNCSFKSGARPSKKLLPAIVGALNTNTLARLIVTAYKWKGPSYSIDVAKGISKIWASRLAQLGRYSIRLEGLEHIAQLHGKFIFAFNHKSYLDFAFGPFAISERHPSLRFLAARDHFLDDPFLYRIMGRAMEVAGVIFVDRKKKTASPKLAAFEASEALTNLDIDIAIFPQGTRAYGNLSYDGHRLDAGYYTSGNAARLLKSGGHIKKGTVYIATDTAIKLNWLERSQVNIVPVVIMGTGIAAPKNSIFVQTETDIVVRISEPIIIKGQQITDYKTFVEETHQRLDDNLKAAIGIHTYLEQRFFRDLRGLLPAADYEHVSVAMKAWRGKDYLIYTILDCIYAGNPKNWPAWLRELSYMMITDVPLASLGQFKERVVKKMLEGG